MKPITEKFLLEVLDSSKYGITTEKEGDISKSTVTSGLDNYDGPEIGIKIDVAGGMINITISNGNKSSEQKFMMFEDEDNMDIEQATANLDEMIEALVDAENNPEVDYNEKLGFDDIYSSNEDEVEDNEEPTESYVVDCKAYIEDDGEVLLVFDELNDNGNIVCWSVNGEHSECDNEYCDSLEEVDASNKEVAEIKTVYENRYLDDAKLNILPNGEYLGVQKSAHKEIYSRD